MEKDKSVCEENNFKTVFDNYSEVIRNFIYYKCGDIQQAEDITQEAFIKLWKNCKKVLFKNAKSFIMKVAQNTFFNEVKHDKIILKYNKNVDTSGLFSHSP